MATYGSRDKPENQFKVPQLGNTSYYLLIDADGLNKGRITIKRRIPAASATAADITVGTIPLDNSFRSSGDATSEEVKHFSSAAAQKAIKNHAIITAQNAGVNKVAATQLISPNTAAPPATPAADPTDPTDPGPGTATTITAGTGFKPIDLGTYASDNQGPPLIYPLNRKESDEYDWLEISTYKYVAGGLIGGINRASSKIKENVGNIIHLPMQPGIQDSNSVSWGEDRLNPFQAGLAGIAADTINKIGNADLEGAARAFFGGLGRDIEKWAKDPNMGGYVSAYFAGQAVGANVIGRQTGVVLNNNLELLFDGPTLRVFNYNYTFTPREDKEAQVVKQIILHFKRHMAVKRGTTGLFLGTPNVFKLNYAFNGTERHPFLNKIKLCALTDFTVDYTPSGSYMTYGDGSMTSYSVKLTFKELDPIYRDDQEEDGGMGY